MTNREKIRQVEKEVESFDDDIRQNNYSIEVYDSENEILRWRREDVINTAGDELDVEIEDNEQAIRELEDEIECWEDARDDLQKRVDEMRRVYQHNLDDEFNPLEWISDEKWAERERLWKESVSRTKAKTQ